MGKDGTKKTPPRPTKLRVLQGKLGWRPLGEDELRVADLDDGPGGFI